MMLEIQRKDVAAITCLVETTLALIGLAASIIQPFLHSISSFTQSRDFLPVVRLWRKYWMHRRFKHFNQAAIVDMLRGPIQRLRLQTSIFALAFDYFLKRYVPFGCQRFLEVLELGDNQPQLILCDSG
jgi:hypothetical protein